MQAHQKALPLVYAPSAPAKAKPVKATPQASAPYPSALKLPPLKAAPATPYGKAKKPKDSLARPQFSTETYRLAAQTYNAGVTPSKRLNPLKPELRDRDFALPHRVPWKYIRERTRAFTEGKETEHDLTRWTDRFQKAATAKAPSAVSHEATQRHISDALTLHQNRLDLIEAVEKHKKGKITAAERDETMRRFTTHINQFAANVPDVGPHRRVNNRVGANFHLNVGASGSLTPMSAQAGAMTPRKGYGVAMRGPEAKRQLILTGGGTHPVEALPKAHRDLIARHPAKILR